MNHPNGVHTPELVVNGSDNPIIVNGNARYINGQTPTADSPNTPVSNIPAPDVKIAMDYQEQESDVRNEPIPIKSFDAASDDTASIIPQPGTPLDPCKFTSFHHIHSSISSHSQATIPVHPPSGTPPPPPGDLLEDVKLAEATPSSEDVVMGDAPIETPATTPALRPTATVISNGNGASTSHSSPHDHEGDHQPPPAKRARLHSDADMASLTHVSLIFPCTPMLAC